MNMTQVCSLILFYFFFPALFNAHAVVKGREGKEKQQIMQNQAAMAELQKKAEREEEEYQKRLQQSNCQQPQMVTNSSQMFVRNFFFRFLFSNILYLLTYRQIQMVLHLKKRLLHSC
jgi:hypothetical protein